MSEEDVTMKSEAVAVLPEATPITGKLTDEQVLASDPYTAGDADLMFKSESELETLKMFFMQKLGRKSITPREGQRLQRIMGLLNALEDVAAQTNTKRLFKP